MCPIEMIINAPANKQRTEQKKGRMKLRTCHSILKRKKESEAEGKKQTDRQTNAKRNKL